MEQARQPEQPQMRDTRTILLATEAKVDGVSAIVTRVLDLVRASRKKGKKPTTVDLILRGIRSVLRRQESYQDSLDRLQYDLWDLRTTQAEILALLKASKPSP